MIGVESLRVTVHEQLAASLLLRRPLHLVTVLVELAQVDSALLFLLAPADPSRPGRIGH